MSEHPRAGSRIPRTFRSLRSLRSPRRVAVAVAATVGLLAFGAGWAYTVQEDDSGATVQAQTGDRPGDAAAGAGASRPASTADAAPVDAARATRGARGAPGAPAAPGAPGTAAPSSDPAEGLTDVSEETRARIPAATRQLVLVTGKGRDSAESTLALYTRPAAGADWVRAGSWPAHNGASGWSSVEREDGDLTTPVGVFTLSDAGGLLPKPPGTKFPYDRNRLFVPTGRGVNGESLAGAFEYVIAIDYNRRTGVSPLDLFKPEGEDKGGGIWLHVDHNGPSQGCIGISKEAMKKLLTTLDPAAKPVIVMGPAGF
ncbi:L,D-transpeptidase family protein [Streptomyces sp. NBC_00597]|uniref:L,D-transpeptidase family protein n=1 Tax=Streptomyces sp. NBC_00597 TaxID=2975786 RepID=UPI0030E45E07